MYVSNLTLTNIRQFDQRTFEFQPGFNLLVGENGVGKTTILRSLLAVLGGTQQMGRRAKLEDDDIRLYTSFAEVTANIHSLNDRLEEFRFRKTLWERAKRPFRRGVLPLVLHYASNEATCSAMKVKQAKRIRDSKKDDFRHDEEFLHEMEEMEFARRQPGPDERRFGNSQSVRDFVGKVISNFSPDFRSFYWRFEPYDCSLLPPPEPKTKAPLDVKLKRQVQSIAMRFFQESWSQRRKRPFDWPDQTKVILTPESLEPKRNHRLPDLREIWEVMRFSPELREFIQACSLEVKLTPRIMIRRKIGALRLSQLSDGKQRLFSLFVDIARQLLLRNPNGIFGRGEAIVLIDEIDVHLHPKWQRRIVPALEDLFPNCQFIATTHSPFVIQAVTAHKLQHVDHRLMGDIRDRGIEEIAVKVMGIEDPQVSVRYLQMLDTAREYFRILENSNIENDSQRQNLRARLRNLSRRYADNPAYQAYLEIHEQLSLGPDELR
jgi:predicted ATPase